MIKLRFNKIEGVHRHTKELNLRTYPKSLCSVSYPRMQNVTLQHSYPKSGSKYEQGASGTNE